MYTHEYACLHTRRDVFMRTPMYTHTHMRIRVYSTCMHSVYRLNSSKRACALCLHTVHVPHHLMHSVYKLYSGYRVCAQRLSTVHSVYMYAQCLQTILG